MKRIYVVFLILFMAFLMGCIPVEKNTDATDKSSSQTVQSAESTAAPEYYTADNLPEGIFFSDRGDKFYQFASAWQHAICKDGAWSPYDDTTTDGYLIFSIINEKNVLNAMSPDDTIVMKGGSAGEFKIYKLEYTGSSLGVTNIGERKFDLYNWVIPGSNFAETVKKSNGKQIEALDMNMSMFNTSVDIGKIISVNGNEINYVEPYIDLDNENRYFIDDLVLGRTYDVIIEQGTALNHYNVEADTMFFIRDIKGETVSCESKATEAGYAVVSIKASELEKGYYWIDGGNNRNDLPYYLPANCVGGCIICVE